jgi:hypothetical protein
MSRLTDLLAQAKDTQLGADLELYAVSRTTIYKVAPRREQKRVRHSH